MKYFLIIRLRNGYHLMMAEVDTGSCQSAIEWILEANFINHQVKFEQGPLQEESSALLKKFFKDKKYKEDSLLDAISYQLENIQYQLTR